MQRNGARIAGEPELWTTLRTEKEEERGRDTQRSFSDLLSNLQIYRTFILSSDRALYTVSRQRLFIPSRINKERRSMLARELILRYEPIWIPIRKVSPHPPFADRSPNGWMEKGGRGKPWACHTRGPYRCSGRNHDRFSRPRERYTPLREHADSRDTTLRVRGF